MSSMTKRISAAAFCAAVAAAPALAAEGGLGFYLLGSKTTMAGFLPPPGIYGAWQNFGYTGNADIDFRTAATTLSGGVDAKAYISLPTAMWVSDLDILGGNLGFTLITPFGGKQVEAGVISSRRGREFNAERDNFAFGDPVLGFTVGWHQDDLNYTLGTLINVPIGQWEQGNPVNIGFNRWVVDTTGAVTYLNHQTGIEASGAVGITYNFENSSTDYKTGTEFHAEAALMQHFSRVFSIGVNGYAYKQIIGDSGPGAILGDFKGQVFAIGPAADVTIMVGDVPLITNLRYFYEFGVENRLKGHAVFANFAIPLGGH